MLKNQQLPNWHEVSRAVKGLIAANFSGAILHNDIYRLRFESGRPDIVMSSAEMVALVGRWQNKEGTKS